MADKRLKRGEAHERLAAEVKLGEDWELRVSFNPAELLDGVRAVGAPDVVISINEPLKPVQIVAATKNGEESDYRYLVMTMVRPANVQGESKD